MSSKWEDDAGRQGFVFVVFSVFVFTATAIFEKNERICWCAIVWRTSAASLAFISDYNAPRGSHLPNWN